jgi:hypothetical protein
MRTDRPLGMVLSSHSEPSPTSTPSIHPNTSRWMDGTREARELWKPTENRFQITWHPSSHPSILHGALVGCWFTLAFLFSPFFCEPQWAGYWERDPVMYNPVINNLLIKFFFAPINNLIAWYWIFKFLLPYWTWINNIGLLTNKLLKLFSQCISVILFYFFKNLQNMSMH